MAARKNGDSIDTQKSGKQWNRYVCRLAVPQFFLNRYINASTRGNPQLFSESLTFFLQQANVEGPKLSSVLITGGDHFIGWHLISKILEIEPDCKISVLDLPSSLPRFPGVTYYDIDPSIPRNGLYELDMIRPRVIFHAACTYSLALPASTFWKVNYIGTQNILRAAKAVGTVKAFIYHCSSSVIEDGISNVLNATEDFPVLFAPEQKYPYPLSKAHAEKAVLDANDRGGMLTVSMRPAGTYGEADFEMMESLIGNARRGRANVQMGDGKNVVSIVLPEFLLESLIYALAMNVLIAIR